MKTISLERIHTKLANHDILIYLVWLLLFLFLIATLTLGYFSVFLPAFFANIGIVIFLFFRKRDIILPDCEADHTKREKNNNILINRTIHAVSIILFFFFFSISLLSLFGESYTKSILYYLCISICAAILIFELFSVNSVISRYSTLFQTFLLSFNILFSNHLIFVNRITQPDFGFHLGFVKEILTTGHITSFQEYGFVNVFVNHHLFAAEITLLTGYNLESIYLLFGSFIVAIGVFFVFIIGKRFVNFQFGLVAAVVFTCLDFYLMWGEHPEHVAYCFGFALICFTIILYTYTNQKLAFYLLFVFSAIAMILTHHLSALIVFVTICSLVLIDIFHVVLTRERSFPSKYIAAFFIMLLFAALYIVTNGDLNNVFRLLSSYFGQYFIKLTSLITNFFPSPTMIVSAPVTSVPVTSIPVTSVPVTSIPVTSVPVTSIPVTSIPVTSIPVPKMDYTKLVSLPVSPPTGYDKIPLITLFENTLGSSLLVFVSILGFCSLIKKRSWFGNFTIINAIFISTLLGMGILFPIAVFLPDRMYPFLQIFGLVFLGAFGILWLRNSIPTRNGFIIFVGICILVGMMSFFSLASIINGFETSPFADKNIAYPKKLCNKSGRFIRGMVRFLHP